MVDPLDVSRHYSSGKVLATIEAAIGQAGKTPETATIEDLAPFDEFHIGGRQASEHFLARLGLQPDMRVLDVGCGVGGPARFAAMRHGCLVTGIDLTQEFIEAGREISRWLSIGDRVELKCGSALAMPFDDQTFDAAYMLHVGMNISEKQKLFREVSRVLKPRAVYGIYDVMRVGEGDLKFPVPWAAVASGSAVAAPEAYRDALAVAGFEIEAEDGRRAFALDYLARMRERMAASAILRMRLEVIDNLAENIRAGRIEPVELLARKR